MHRAMGYRDEKFIPLLCSRRRMERKPAVAFAKGWNQTKNTCFTYGCSRTNLLAGFSVHLINDL